MGNLDDMHENLVIDNLVDDSIYTLPHAVKLSG